jgi:hypothetical protein
MGWSLGWDSNWKRDIGYGVPAHCDHPGCRRVIDRGLSYVCGGEPYGGQHGCGLFFCDKHLSYSGKGCYLKCERCANKQKPFYPKPDHKSWIHFKMHDWSWAEWRKENGYPEPKRMRKRPAEYAGWTTHLGYAEKE